MDTDGAILVTGSFDKSLRVWRLDTKTLVKSIYLSVWIKSVCLKGDLAIVGCWDGTIQCWHSLTSFCGRNPGLKFFVCLFVCLF